MTPEALLSELCNFPTPIDSSREVLPPTSRLSRIDVDAPLDGTSNAGSISPRPDEAEHWLRYHEQRRAALDVTLRKLCGLDLPGKEHVEAYVHDQYRRHLSPNTLKNSFTVIRDFLQLVKEGGKGDLATVSREDIVDYLIEHEQDGGVKPSTIDMRMRLLRAFFHFLIDRGILGPEMLLKKVKIKVPEALPRAMDPDDVRRLIKVVTDTRDKAMVLVLLRTGMRIGELLHTLVSEVSVKERKIEIYEAQKTQVGRVVYLSKDAVVALKAWLRKRESQCKAWGYQPMYTVIDPSARNRNLVTGINVEDAYLRAGEPTIAGQNEPEAGVFEVKRRLQHEPPLFHVSPTCQTWLWERGIYRMDDRAEGKFAVVKENDHLMDATRYVAMSRPLGAAQGPPEPRRDEYRYGHAPPAEWANQYDPSGSPPLGSMT